LADVIIPSLSLRLPSEASAAVIGHTVGAGLSHVLLEIPHIICNVICIKIYKAVSYSSEEFRLGAHLPLVSLEPVGG